MQRHHHIELNALCTFTLADADCRVQLRFRIHLHRVSLCRINCGQWAPPRFARENGKDVPQSMLDESVKGIVNCRPKVTPSQCSESGITLKSASGKMGARLQIFCHTWRSSGFWFVRALCFVFTPAYITRPSGQSSTHTAIKSPKPVVSNPFVRNGETWWCTLEFSSCRQRLRFHNS